MALIANAKIDSYMMLRCHKKKRENVITNQFQT